MRKLATILSLMVITTITVFAQTPTTPRIYILRDKITEAKKLLAPIAVSHSDKIVKIYGNYKKVVVKNRRGRKRTKLVRTSYDDFAWKEAVLAVLDQTGTITVIKIRREQQKPVTVTSGYSVSLEYRPSHITWNGKNTAFSVRTVSGGALIVIGIKWLETDSEKILMMKGRKKRWVTRLTAEPVLYVPYSTSLHKRELIEAGNDHYDARSQTAFDDLNRKEVKSLVFPTKNVTEIPVINQLSIKNLCLIEQTDPTDFDAYVDGEWKYNPFERVLIRLGANGDSEFAGTKSHAGGRGPHQFMQGTWSIVRYAYPKAELPDYLTGTSNHKTSIQAAALLYDYNLNELVKKFGLSILQDPQLEFYLAAGYNGGIGRVIRGIKNYGKDWTRGLLSETRIYVEELEYLHGHPLVKEEK